jgi:hypothetical protein
MMVAQVDRNGTAVDGPRGCALAWSLAFMPNMSEKLSRSQYQMFSRNWAKPIWGMVGLAEWPPGKKGTINTDTGPVFAGIGAAASGIGIAAARANGDYENWYRLLRGLESIGAPTWTLSGEKFYLFRHALLADILALWGKTNTSWVKPLPPQQVSMGAADEFGIPLFLAALISTAAMGALALWTRKLWKAFRQQGLVLNVFTYITCAIQIAALLFTLCLPLIEIPIFMLVVAIIERDLIKQFRSNKMASSS